MMTRNLSHGMNGMNNDLEWQYTMLAAHVQALLDEIDFKKGNGLAEPYLFEEYIEPMRRRMDVIKELEKKDRDVCNTFAQALTALSEKVLEEREGVAINHWPSSQLCMDCEHGEFIMSEDEPVSTYLCHSQVQLGPCESRCEVFSPKHSRSHIDPTDYSGFPYLVEED